MSQNMFIQPIYTLTLSSQVFVHQSYLKCHSIIMNIELIFMVLHYIYNAKKKRHNVQETVEHL